MLVMVVFFIAFRWIHLSTPLLRLFLLVLILLLMPALYFLLFFFKQKTAYDLGLGIPAEPLFRSCRPIMSIDVVEVVIWRESSVSGGSGAVQMFLRWQQRKP